MRSLGDLEFSFQLYVRLKLKTSHSPQKEETCSKLPSAIDVAV
jgi:hypothetical protein